MEQEVLYHYTSGSVFQRILFQEAIEPDRTEPNNEKEIPTVTFSADPEWEKTRYRIGRMPDGQLVMLSKDLLKQFDGGLYRIVVPKSVAPLDWFAMKEQLNLSKQAKQGIYDFAISVGARIKNWYATTKAVPESEWITVEKLNDENQWIELSVDEIPEPNGEPLPPVVELFPDQRVAAPVDDSTNEATMVAPAENL